MRVIILEKKKLFNDSCTFCKKYKFKYWVPKIIVLNILVKLTLLPTNFVAERSILSYFNYFNIRIILNFIHPKKTIIIL